MHTLIYALLACKQLCADVCKCAAACHFDVGWDQIEWLCAKKPNAKQIC